MASTSNTNDNANKQTKRVYGRVKHCPICKI
jgi:hypothetical protein